jgi:ribosomal protein S18 acetylase RimI-like enzyme
MKRSAVERGAGLVPALRLTLEVVIRAAQADDLARLEWGGQYAHFRDVFRRTFEEQRASRRLMLVADLRGYPVGQIFVQFTSGDRAFADGRTRGYLYSLRVLEPLQRLGLGTRLMEAAEAALGARGFEWAVIAAAKDNPAALRLYERRGYRVFSDDPGRWEFVDHEGRLRSVVEPCWVLERRLRAE